MPAAVETRELTKRFGRTTAVDRVSVRIEAGASAALLGPNGAGKTTWLRLCATLLRPTHGEVHVLGHDARGDGSAVRRGLGFLGHESLLYPDLSPLENLRFYARLFGVPHPGPRIDDLIARTGLTGWAHRPVRTLSRGLLQRCALARVLLHEPALLLLDEPFTGLDLDAAATLSELLVAAHARGATILMSTHDLPRALAVCSTALVMRRGQLVWQGSIASMRAADLAAAYQSLVHTPAAPGEASAAHP
jgi:heme exporter protein A